MWKIVSRIVFWLWDWRVEGDIPDGTGNCVIIYAPHTSNTDFFLGIGTFQLLNKKVNILIKSDWFVFPFTYPLRSLGCLPINRSRSTNYVDQMVEQLVSSEERRILVCPEGTRKAAEAWKTGFYHAAVKAEVPLVLSYLNYKERFACIAQVYHPTGCFQKDMDHLEQFYSNIEPRYPENYNPVIYKHESEWLEEAE